jgi:hypothetical protein
MGYMKPTQTTRQFLETSPLPNHGKTYTVIPHKDVISHTETLLQQNGFIIERELYRANMNAQVAQGIYHIKAIPQVFDMYSPEVKEEEDLGMMFAWTNSYDKSTRFQCAIGGYVMCCNNGLVSGDMATFARKHTGAADSEVNAQISSQIKHAHKFFKRIVTDKNSLRTITLSVKEQSELLGRLFFDDALLDVTQMSCIKAEMDTPSYDYKADQDNAWAFYNHVTHAFKKSHPRTWLSDQQKFHDFMVQDVLGKMGINQQDTIDTNDNLDLTEPDSLPIEGAESDPNGPTMDQEGATRVEDNLDNTESEPIPSNTASQDKSSAPAAGAVEEEIENDLSEAPEEEIEVDEDDNDGWVM